MVLPFLSLQKIYILFVNMEKDNHIVNHVGAFKYANTEKANHIVNLVVEVRYVFATELEHIVEYATNVSMANVRYNVLIVKPLEKENSR